jgi:uncharacterized protein YjbI with pentapeptide repeats
MANDEHVALLRTGVAAWNEWRDEKTAIFHPDLGEADLSRERLVGANLFATRLFGATLIEANLSEADLGYADLREADLSKADLRKADLGHAHFRKANLHCADIGAANLHKADLVEANLLLANLGRADLRAADLRWANLGSAKLSGADLSKANLGGANLSEAQLGNANLSGANLQGANLVRANLSAANLGVANLCEADLREANLSGAVLREADLRGAQLVDTDLTGADLTGCKIYGVSAWGLKLDGETKQQNLVITPKNEPAVTVDNIEVAQFVYLLLHNEKIRNVIDTVGRKGVLLLGRFTEGRIKVLNRLREELRLRGYVPIVFNFDKPETKDFTETVRLLAGLSKFVIADITNPKSSPLELQATVPEIMVPFQPIIQEGETPFEMLQDLWIKHRDWVFEPIEYSSIDRLAETMDAEIIKPAEERFNELVMRRAETMKVRRV